MYIVHILDRNIFKELNQHQRSRPILINEVKTISDWVEIKYEGIEPNDTTFYTIKGISDKTISFSTFINQEKYYKDLNLEDSLLLILREINQDRNRLHFNSSLSSEFTSNSYDEFLQLADFLKRNIQVNLDKMFNFMGLTEDERKVKLMIKKHPLT
jgi:hypothetical protein